MGERHFHFLKIVPHGRTRIRPVRFEFPHGMDMGRNQEAARDGSSEQWTMRSPSTVTTNRLPFFDTRRRPSWSGLPFCSKDTSAMATASGLVRPKRLKYQTYASGERA